MRKLLLLSVFIIGSACLGQAATRPRAAAISPAYRANLAATRVRAKQSSKVSRTKATRRLATRRVRRRRVVWNPVLPGSRESLLKQNEEIDAAGLTRIEDDEQLQELIDQDVLVPVSGSRYLNLNPGLKEDRRTCRPATRDFVEDLGQAYYAEFQKPIAVTSLVRTVEQQRKLRRRNRNAAPEEGDTASSHLAGTTVDIGKRGLSKKEHAWLDHYLGDLKEKNLVEPLEERRQACYHIMVFDRYQNWRDDLAISRMSKAEATGAQR